MEVNSAKRPHHHHLTCLSGSSQAPLIGGGVDTGSERSTPISAHSLPFGSPPGKAQPQPLHHHSHQPQEQQQQQHPSASFKAQAGACPTPLNGSATSIFFPPLPARSNQSLQQQHLVGGAKSQQPPLEPSPNCRSPKIVADFNMNAERERNREASQAAMISSPNHQNRFITPNTNPSSRLNSPLDIPANSFAGFFNEPHQHSIASQHGRSSHSSIDLNGNGQAENAMNNWPQQEDSYHLYHEPVDPDEQTPLVTSMQSKLDSPTSSSQIVSLNSYNNKNIQPLDQVTSNQTTSTRPNLTMKISSDNNNNNGNSPVSIKGRQDWPFVGPSTPSDKSPTNTNNGHSIAAKPLSPMTNTSPFADRSGLSRRNDVSADIYFCYVTLKSNERANHRSRSYHGQKNSGLQNQQNQPLYFKDATKNLSSTNVADLPLSPSEFASTMIPIHFRDHCVRELIETESNYVHALDMILNCFAKPLETHLKREDHLLIFGHIKYFHNIHSSFQADLIKAASRSYNKDIVNLISSTRNSLAPHGKGSATQTSSNPSTPTTISNIPQQFLNVSPLPSPAAQPTQEHTVSPMSSNTKGANGCSPKISLCFLNVKDKFLKYGEYCATLTKAQSVLDELTNKNETIAAQLDRCQQDANEGKFKLRDLLSLPMQRILKYHLLLAQLIKNTSATSEDYHGLKRAHEAMVDLGQYINEVKRDTEALQIMSDIEQSITGLNMPPNTQLTDYGRLVTDGFIRIKTPNDTKSKPAHDAKLKLPHDTKVKQKRYVFVFDKVMLLCKLSGVRGYQYKEALVLSEYDLIVNPAPIQTESRHAGKDKWSFNFNLVRSSDKTVYSFYAKTVEFKAKWVEAIQKAMDNIRPAICQNGETNHEFLMYTFDRATSCDHCGKLLLGLYYQGYRCCNCFAPAHKKCLAALRPCGPAARSKASNTLTLSRGQCNEPPSPSVRSNCSEDSHNHFMQFPPSNSSSTQCVDLISKNEYSNIESRDDATINQSSSFRESGSRTPITAQRPVSSMINVSLQNSTNHLLQQRRLLKGSNSTPAISNRSSLRAKANSDYNGSEEAGQLRIQTGDLVLVYRSSVKQTQLSKDDVEQTMAHLKITNCNQNNIMPANGITWLFGKNMRTGKEGQFPSSVVDISGDQCRSQVGPDEVNQPSNLEDPLDTMPLQSGNSYVNFILSDHIWFHGRMERDRAQSLLENTPHGTFLVRVSTKHNGSYVISLNYNSQIKHMRIYVSKDNQFYLSQNRYFKSVIELVAWYEKNSLVESFHMLDARLAVPYKPC